jgi:hypothetical protein
MKIFQNLKILIFLVSFKKNNIYMLYLFVNQYITYVN